MFTPTSNTIRTKTSNVAPIAMVKVKTINKIQVDRSLVCIPATGSTWTMIQSRSLPPDVVMNVSPEKRMTITANGFFNTLRLMKLRNIQLPEFVNGRVVGGMETRLFHSPECRYDIIFGRDFLQSSMMKFCFHTNTTNWLGVTLDMKPVNHFMIDYVINVGIQPRDFYKENII